MAARIHNCWTDLLPIYDQLLDNNYSNCCCRRKLVLHPFCLAFAAVWWLNGEGWLHVTSLQKFYLNNWWALTIIWKPTLCSSLKNSEVRKKDASKENKSLLWMQQLFMLVKTQKSSIVTRTVHILCCSWIQLQEKSYKLSTLVDTCGPFLFSWVWGLELFGKGRAFFFCLGGFGEVHTEISYIQIKHMVVTLIKKDKCFPSFKVSFNWKELRGQKGEKRSFVFKEK